MRTFLRGLCVLIIFKYSSFVWLCRFICPRSYFRLRVIVVLGFGVLGACDLIITFPPFHYTIKSVYTDGYLLLVVAVVNVFVCDVSIIIIILYYLRWGIFTVVAWIKYRVPIWFIYIWGCLGNALFLAVMIYHILCACVCMLMLCCMFVWCGWSTFIRITHLGRCTIYL